MGILEIIFYTIAGGGGLLAVIKFLIDIFSKNSIRSRNILIANMNHWKSESDKNSVKVEEKDKRIIELLEEIVNLKVQITEKRSDFEDIPLIYLRLDHRARAINFTHLYAKTFIRPTGKNPFAYHGKTSQEFWGDEIGAEYTTNDFQVLETEKPFYGLESLMYNGKNMLEDFVVYKWISYTSSGDKNLNVLIIDDEELVKLFKECKYAKQELVSRGKRNTKQ